MKTVIGIVVALVIMAVVGTVLARLMQRDVAIVELEATPPDRDESEAPTEEASISTSAVASA